MMEKTATEGFSVACKGDDLCDNGIVGSLRVVQAYSLLLPRALPQAGIVQAYSLVLKERYSGGHYYF